MKPWSPVAPHRSQLGESPVWHPTEGMLYWIDIRARQLLRCNVFMGEVDAWELPAEPGCIAPARSGGWVIALRDGVYRAREWRGDCGGCRGAAGAPDGGGGVWRGPCAPSGTDRR